MECNRDEAVRAREIAERKFLAKDINGARKFALKAQNLYPELEGISQMVATLEVYICGEEETACGESNWYGVLGVTPLADEETIRKQYRKLALLLHPDKNRSVGAEGAFKLVSLAWSLLSDKSKRVAYDQRCGMTKNQMRNGVSSTQPQNGFHNFTNAAASKMKAPKGTSKKNPASATHSSRKKERSTFWTVCNCCKMQYEYLRRYLNHNLLCPNCKEAYYAFEVNPPSTRGYKVSSETRNSQQRKNANYHQGSDVREPSKHSNESNINDFQWVPFSDSNGARPAVQAANMVQQAYEKIKRERQKAQAAARKEEALLRKKYSSKRVMDMESCGQSNVAKRRKVVEDSGPSKDTVNKVNGESEIHHQVHKRYVLQKCMNNHDGVCDYDCKQLLMDKVRDELRKRLNGCISTSSRSDATSEEIPMHAKENEMTKAKEVVFVVCKNKFCEPADTENRKKINFESSGVCLDGELVKRKPADVLDSDFHDFDKDRTENCFKANQVWAVYDDDDGMPRNYALIHNVISLKPFKVRISWLRSLIHSSLGHVNWFLSGSSKTCGEFGIGRVEIYDSVDYFSHCVRWMKCTSKTFQIFPRKGDVWALYRNWSPKWNELTEDEVIHKYDMVEVLEDCDEELGVLVVPLVKVAGFKTVFQQHMDPMEIRRIPNEEMGRFSHQVPARSVTGEEGLECSGGCHELDPAATPIELIEVVSDFERIELTETDDEIEIVKTADCDGNTRENLME